MLWWPLRFSPKLICKLLVFVFRNVWLLYRVQQLLIKPRDTNQFHLNSLKFDFFHYDAFVYNKLQSDKYSVYVSEAETVLYICLLVVTITFVTLIHVKYQNWRSLTLYAESQIPLHVICDSVISYTRTS